MIEIRPASLEDAPAMARVTVDTWFAAHRGQVSDDVWQNRRSQWGYAESEAGWRRTLAQAKEDADQMLVATDDGEVIAVCAAKRVDPSGAEVTVLYVDVGHQRAGLGRLMLEDVFRHWRGLGVSTLQIGVLDANGPARDFYEALGGRHVDTREHEDGPEVVYAWDLVDT